MICDIDQWSGLPDADVHFIGFGIHNNNCSLDIINLLEQITKGHIARFATCGNIPSEIYKTNLEKRLSVWLPDEAGYLGMFLCQGRVEKEQQKIMLDKMSDQAEKLIEVFDESNTHPDRDDYFMAADFAETIHRKLK